MEFDKSKVYTALNADELKVGSMVVVANDITTLKENVQNNRYGVLLNILSEDCVYRFEIHFGMQYCLAYLVEEPEENKLKWQDVWIGDVLYKKANPDVQFLVTAKNFNVNADKHIFAADAWILDTALENDYAKVGDEDD